MKHDRLQQNCYKWFHNTYPSLRGLMWHNWNNPANARQGAYLKSIGLQAGVFDLLFYFNKTLYGFDIKVGRDKYSQGQKNWKQKVEEQGGYCMEIRSEEEFKSIVGKIISGDSELTPDELK